MLVTVKESVLLLDTEPRLLVLSLLHDLETLLPLVGLHGLLEVVEGFTEDQEVVSSGEWTGIHLDRLEVDIRVGSISLIAGAPVIIPLGQILHLAWLRLQHLHLGPHGLPGPVNPHIGGAHPGTCTEQDQSDRETAGARRTYLEGGRGISPGQLCQS